MSRRRIFDTISTWNRRLHIYVGLYLLLFVWLFSISGLLLNHPEWEFAQFWTKREETSFERQVTLSTEADDFTRAKSLAKQLGCEGEIQNIVSKPDQNLFNFRVMRPGKSFVVKTDLEAQRATVTQFKVNLWGKIQALHQFDGVRMNVATETRDWYLTKLWSLCIDAVAFGMILMVIGGLYIWYQRRTGRQWGVIVLCLGVLVCGLFVVGLSWLP